MNDFPQPDWQTEDGRIRLYCGDCLDLLPKLPSGCVDACVTDPPYGTGERLRVGGRFEDSRQDWDEWRTEWLLLLPCKPMAMFVPPARIPDSIRIAPRLLAWCSQNPVARKGVSPRYGIQPILARGPFPSSYGLDWFKYRSNIQTPNHPHEKPAAVMGWLVETMAIQGGAILDPFMGSGTTGVACIQTGRRFIGIEKEPKYFDIAVKRIQDALKAEKEKLQLTA